MDKTVAQRLRSYFDKACQILKIDGTAYQFVFERIGPRFPTIFNAAELSDNILYINEDWVDAALAASDEVDLKFQMYHEARHIYQRNVISDFSNRGKSSELPSVINQWKNDLLHYQRNEGDAATAAANRMQNVEIDANAFANVMLVVEGHGARIPEGQDEQMLEVMQQIAKKYFNATIS